MNEWIAENAATVIGWLGGLVMFGFVFGRRFQRLEDADTNLARTIDGLAKTVDGLVTAVHGHTGNAALARALEKLAEALEDTTSRTGSTERSVDRLDARVTRVEEAVAEFRDIARKLNENQTMLARIDERIQALNK